MKIDTTIQLDFNNVLIRPKRTTIESRSNVNLTREFIFPHSKLKWKGVPVISSNMDTTGTFEVYDVLSKHKIITCMNKFYTLDDYKQKNNVVCDIDGEFDADNSSLDPNYFMVSTGISDNDFDNLCEILSIIDCNWICIDVANGYMQKLIEFCIKVRKQFSNKIIVAGNVATREMVEELIINGKVDVVKVGIGPGSACLTRLKTGVGVPQLSAIIECADAALGVNGFIIGDGGITSPSDMAKAFCAGSDFTMVGGQFAGHDENPGKIIEEKGKKYKLFYGMSSTHAMMKHYNKMNKYRSSE